VQLYESGRPIEKRENTLLTRLTANDIYMTQLSHGALSFVLFFLFLSHCITLSPHHISYIYIYSSLIEPASFSSLILLLIYILLGFIVYNPRVCFDVFHTPKIVRHKRPESKNRFTNLATLGQTCVLPNRSYFTEWPGGHESRQCHWNSSIPIHNASHHQITISSCHLRQDD
jgi:hypothetical protein